MDETSEAWGPDGRTYPYFDENIEAMVIKHVGDDTTEQYMVSVAPMMFNDRVVLTSRTGYPRTWVAGFCYPKGPAAALAAMAWDPLTQQRPAGYERVAGDERDLGSDPEAHPTTSHLQARPLDDRTHR